MLHWYVDTLHPLAENSPDHTHPFGTARDNFSNPRFNEKLLALYERPISVLDLGCAGGGFVKSMLDGGNEALGLEGSNYSLVNQRAEWATIPGNLLTCDVSQPFTVHTGSHSVYEFDVVTAWEFVEHIAEGDLPQLWANVRRHLKHGGLFILTACDLSQLKNGVELHQTRKPGWWWAEQIEGAGFIELPEIKHYLGHDWVRNWWKHDQYAFVFKKL